MNGHTDTSPRLLYISFDVGYMNPTRELLVEALRRATDLTLFGPGYQPQAVVEQGVDVFYDKHGPFDIVVADEFCIQDYRKLEEGGELRFVNHACRFERSLMGMGRQYQAFLRRYKGVRMLALLQSDYYNFPGYRMEAIEALGDYFLTWGREFIRPVSECESTRWTGDSANSRILDHAHDRYLDFITRKRDRVISCPQFVSEAEAHWQPIATRPRAWSAPGSSYDARVRARALLRANGLPLSGASLPYVYAIAYRLGINLYGHYATIALMHRLFRRAIRRAKYGFTCGSALRWPIRKYFEIPANGAVLVCEQPTGFEALGFNDRSNAVVCDVNNILDVHHWLEEDADRAQAIADAGRKLVLRTHSVSARAVQIRSAINRICEGQFVGSRWVDGELVFDS